MNRASCVAVFLLLPVLLQASLRLEIVDDTGRDDVHVLFRANVNASNSLSPATLTVADGTSTVDSTLLSSLPAAGDTVVSPYTGKTLTPRVVTVDYLDSGVLNVSYGAIQSTSASPAPSPSTSTTRFDQMEFTFIPGQDSVANLTSIDQFAIPIQLELFDSASPSGDPVDARYMYSSTDDMRTLFTKKGLKDAIYGLKNGELVTAPSGAESFVRLLGPQQVVRLPGSGNSPAPYSSFSRYLASLAEASGGTSFSVDGSANNATYSYTASLSQPSSGDYSIDLTGTTSGPMPVLTYTVTEKDGTKVEKTVQLPASAKVSIKLPSDSLDFNIYGCPLDSSSYAIEGVPDAAVDQNSNTVYSAMVRDVLSALNFGFVGGTEGSGTADWFSEVVPEAPFGAARPSADGYYNPWAALFYNHSDAYGFAFSDRNLPSPAVTLQDGYTLRVTLLSDDRLTSPVVIASDPKESADQESYEVTLTWTAVPGVDSYEVQIIEPQVETPAAVAKPAKGSKVSYQATGLEKGTPYTFRVYSTEGSGSSKIRSAYREVTVFPPDQRVAPTGNAFTFQVSFNTADADKISHVMIDDLKLTLQSGVWLTNNGLPARPTASKGENEFVVQVFAGGKVIYAGVVAFTLAEASASDPSKYTISGQSFPLFGNEQDVILTNPSQSPFENGVPAVFGITFTPVGTKVFEPVDLNATTLLGEASLVGDSFFHSPWMGLFAHDSDWFGNYLFSEDLGWIYVVPDDEEESALMWISALNGWFWGDEDSERWLLGYFDRVWYYVMSAPGGAFVNDSSTGQWRYVPRFEE